MVGSGIELGGVPVCGCCHARVLRVVVELTVEEYRALWQSGIEAGRWPEAEARYLLLRSLGYVVEGMPEFRKV